MREVPVGNFADVMRRADEYREEARRRALIGQENPFMEEWEEPPRYGLV